MNVVQPTADLTHGISLSKTRFQVDYLRNKTRRLLDQLGVPANEKMHEDLQESSQILANQQPNYYVLDKRLEFQPLEVSPVSYNTYENLTSMQRISPYQLALDDYMQYGSVSF